MDNTPIPDDQQPVDYSYTEGTAVYDAEGQKVGVVGQPETQGYYLVVQKGWLFTYEVYVPITAIHAQDVNGIYLNLTKDQLQDDQWKVPPGGGAAVEAAPPASIPPTELPGEQPDPLTNGILPGPIPIDPLGNR